MNYTKFLFLGLTSCGVYSTHWDCPPGRGVGCTPVNEVLNMIVEREQGEDLFVTDPGTALLLRQQEELVSRVTMRQKKLAKLRLVQEDSGDLVCKEETGEQ